MSRENRYIYAYCAMYQADHRSVSLTYIDGVAQMVKRIESHEDYRSLKHVIDSARGDKLVLLNLSYLVREQDDEQA